jgi:hypothetical protein
MAVLNIDTSSAKSAVQAGGTGSEVCAVCSSDPEQRSCPSVRVTRSTCIGDEGSTRLFVPRLCGMATTELKVKLLFEAPL